MDKIKLTENDLKKIIRKSIKRAINENLIPQSLDNGINNDQSINEGLGSLAYNVANRMGNGVRNVASAIKKGTSKLLGTENLDSPATIIKKMEQRNIELNKTVNGYKAAINTLINAITQQGGANTQQQGGNTNSGQLQESFFDPSSYFAQNRKKLEAQKTAEAQATARRLVPNLDQLVQIINNLHRANGSQPATQNRVLKKPIPGPGITPSGGRLGGVSKA